MGNKLDTHSGSIRVERIPKQGSGCHVMFKRKKPSKPCTNVAALAYWLASLGTFIYTDSTQSMPMGELATVGNSHSCPQRG